MTIGSFASLRPSLSCSSATTLVGLLLYAEVNLPLPLWRQALAGLTICAVASVLVFRWHYWVLGRMNGDILMGYDGPH